MAIHAMPDPAAARRRVVARSAGHRHGPITRLVSPGDLGELIKPFVFLDWFEMEKAEGPGFPMHPHSGIATHTTVLSGSFSYVDTTGKSGVLPPGSIEWMQAGGGVWHGGNAGAGEHIQGYQLWVALPEALENAPAESDYVMPEDIQSDGPVRVLLGEYGTARCAIQPVASINYLHVRLEEGQSWRYDPPQGHNVGWVAVHEGILHSAGEILRQEVAVFEEATAPLDFTAQGKTSFVLGSAVKHPHPLVLGYYSVHTSPEALRRGEAGIEAIGKTIGRTARRS